MLEKLGKFLREFFVYGPKGNEPSASPEPAKDLGGSRNRVEAIDPTIEAKPTPKDNVVIAPIKKESKSAVKNVAKENKPKEIKTTAIKTSATKTRKTPAATPTKATKAAKNPKV